MYEKNNEISGQFNLAKIIPGKEEFHETIRYFEVMLKKYGVHQHLNTEASVEVLQESNFDDIVVSSGISQED